MRVVADAFHKRGYRFWDLRHKPIALSGIVEEGGRARRPLREEASGFDAGMRRGLLSVVRVVCSRVSHCHPIYHELVSLVSRRVFVYIEKYGGSDTKHAFIWPWM